MRFEDFVLQLDASPRGGFRARVLKSPFGEGTVEFSIPSLADVKPARNKFSISRNLYLEGGALTLNIESPLGIGTELFRSVFQGQVRTLLDKCLGQLEILPDLGLRLKIKIDPNDDLAGELIDLPWELLCHGETEDFFALSRQTSLVRHLDVPRPSQPTPFTPPLQILAVGASPRGLEPLDLKEEARRLEDLNRSSSGVDVRFLLHASTGSLRQALSSDNYNVLHFMGHGTFDSVSGDGMLAFEGTDGFPDLVSGKAFASKLRDLRSLGVVVLNACDTARAGHYRDANPFLGVAAALVLGGVPAVVAMQNPISDLAAIDFSAALYRHLARGASIDEALTEGRQAIHSSIPEGFEWATPVLFLRVPDGNVFVARPAGRPVSLSVPLDPTPSIVPATPNRKSMKHGSMPRIALCAACVVLLGLLFIKVVNLLVAPVAALAKDSPGEDYQYRGAKSVLATRGLAQSLSSFCIRRRAWMAYFRDDEGVLAPVRDTVNTRNDKDWIGLQFTDYDGPRIRLGVLKLVDKSAEFADKKLEVPVLRIQEMLTVALYNTKRFDVIDQRKIQEIEAQIPKDAVDPGTSSIINIGKLLGAQYLVYGTVREWSPGRGRDGTEISLTLTLTDVISGQMLFITAERARGGRMIQETPVGDAISACANKAAFKIAAFLRAHKWKGSVVNIKGADLYIDAGSQQGMSPQTKLSVQASRGFVKDFQSDMVLGEDLRNIGTLEVIAVQNGFSIARIVEGCGGIKKGDRVELAADPAPSPTIPECAPLDVSITP